MNNKGFSVHIVLGRWSKPIICKESLSLRICLGWISITFWKIDTEVTTNHLINKMKKCGCFYEINLINND